MSTPNWLCAALALGLAVSGAMAPLTAAAQGMQPEMTRVSGAGEPSEGARVGAGFLNIVYVPGKAILCGTGAVASTVLMLLTFGSGYHAAVSLFNEGCGGRWVLTPYDVAERQPPEAEPY